ncbi:MAG: methyltransferase domain-containing protein [Pseudomonadales bacterium]|nr:methyltransferase domain-containing protein [Pseudomonadales bacterium]
MFFGKKYKTYRIGDVDIRIQLPQDSNSIQTVDALPLFDIVWPSSEILCQILENQNVEGKRILEVGCGMALVSLYLNARDADITAMDIQIKSSDLLTVNTRLNRSKAVPFVNASWSETLTELGEFDLIVASDVLYEPQHILTLPRFLNQHIKTGGEVIIVDPDRGRTDAFRSQMLECGFAYESVRPELSDRSGAPYRGVVDRFHL